MSLAVVRKTFRDHWLITVVALLGIVLLEVFIIRFVLEAAKDLALLKPWLDRPLIKGLIRLALGDDLVGDLSVSSLATAGLAHPLLYATTWTLLLTQATASGAGEISRGTADLLLTLPISRARIYISSTFIWLVSGVAIGATALFGLWLGTRLFGLHEPLRFGGLALAAVNFVALAWCVAAVAMLVSSVTSRRGWAIGIVIVLLLASDVVNFVSQFWPLAQRIGFLGFLHYYRPLPIVRTGVLPVEHLAVLLGTGLLAWLVGLWRFSRRDIPAA